MSDEQRINCNRCRKRLTPEQATRDRGKAGYIHREECRVRYRQVGSRQTLTEACEEEEARNPEARKAAENLERMAREVKESREPSEAIEARARALINDAVV